VTALPSLLAEPLEVLLAQDDVARATRARDAAVRELQAAHAVLDALVPRRIDGRPATLEERLRLLVMAADTREVREALARVPA
jgi:hypothetical protein